MRISDWSSDVCSSDLVLPAVLFRVPLKPRRPQGHPPAHYPGIDRGGDRGTGGGARGARLRHRQLFGNPTRIRPIWRRLSECQPCRRVLRDVLTDVCGAHAVFALAAYLAHRRCRCSLDRGDGDHGDVLEARSTEHTSELQSLMRISYAVFCLKKKTKINI